MNARHLQEPEAARIKRARTVDLRNKPSAGTVTQEIGKRPRAGRPRHYHPRAERKRRHCKVAIGVVRKQIAAHRAHHPNLRPADLARRLVQERELSVGEDLYHCHPSTDAHDISRGDDLAQRAVGAPNKATRRLASIDSTHRERTAAEIERLA